MERLEVAKHLTDEDYQLLLSVQAKHSRTMGVSKRENYKVEDIVRVKKEVPGVLSVHYRNGDWWHYMKDGTWY